MLFVPVSGEKGVGEYYRSLTIAGGAQRRWPRARIHFVVNRSAGYADQVPYPTVRVEGSPTYNSPLEGGLSPGNVVVLLAVATHEMIDLLSGARPAGVEQAVRALETTLAGDST